MEENFEELYNESLNMNKFDKTITGTVIQISRKGEIFFDFDLGKFFYMTSKT